MKDGKYWDDSWGLVDGCTLVSDACLNCWAAARVWRFRDLPRYEGLVTKMHGRPTFTGQVRVIEKELDKPLRRRVPTVYAVWNDLFHEDVPIEFISKAFDVMAACPRHTFIVCTKRPGFMETFIMAWIGGYHHEKPLDGLRNQLSNVILMTTAEDQRRLEERVPHLGRLADMFRGMEMPRFKFGLSIEPMLGWLDLREDLRVLDWVVCGGETGPFARPADPDAVRMLRDQCARSKTPFWFKGWGEWWGASVDGEKETIRLDNGRHLVFWDDKKGDVSPAKSVLWRVAADREIVSFRVGRRTAGRLLDGRTWDGTPWFPKDVKGVYVRVSERP